MRYPRLFIHFLSLTIKRVVEYRGDFYLGLVVTFLRYSLGLLLVWAIFQRVPSINGWSYPEVLTIYGMFYLSTSLTGVFTPTLYRLGIDYILGGGLDRVLLRPVDPLFQIVFNFISADGLGELLPGLVALLAALPILPMQLGWLGYAWLVIAVLCGALVYFSIVLFSVLLSFWIELPYGILPTTQSFGPLAQYPLDILPGWLRTIMTWLVPFGFTAFLPAAALFRPQTYGVYFILTPLFSLAFFAAAYTAWKIGLDHYVGSGH